MHTTQEKEGGTQGMKGNVNGCSIGRAQGKHGSMGDLDSLAGVERVSAGSQTWTGKTSRRSQGKGSR